MVLSLEKCLSGVHLGRVTVSSDARKIGPAEFRLVRLVALGLRGRRAKSCQDFLNLLDYSLVVISWLDVATSVTTYRERAPGLRM